MKRETTAAHDIVRTIQPATCASAWPEYHGDTSSDIQADHFTERDGIRFAGTHLILDFWGARRLDDTCLMERTLRECVSQCGATLLHIHLHHFTPEGGISGVAVLAESHISVHTWPEKNFAAFDIFMCGSARPEEAILILKRTFLPSMMNITESLRGIVHHA
jgi:S-adenosylmethionine decarboxylase